MKQVIVMRKDLGMRKGKMIAQGAHASLKAVLENLKHPCVLQWLASKFTKIVVSVNSEEELLGLVALAEEWGIINALITDAGLTEFNGVPTNTCAAFGPALEEDLDPLTGQLPLL